VVEVYHPAPRRQRRDHAVYDADELVIPTEVGYEGDGSGDSPGNATLLDTRLKRACRILAPAELA